MQIRNIMIDISARKVPMSTNKVFIFKLTIEEHIDIVKVLIQAKFTLFDLTKSTQYSFLEIPGSYRSCIKFP